MHVFLDSALADTQAQFQELSTNPFCAPKPILSGHLPDQGDGFLGDLGRTRSGLGLMLPDQAKELPMPPEQGVWLDDEEGLFPRPNEPCQHDEEKAIRFRACWPFHLPLEDDELLAEKGISAISSYLLRPRSVRMASGNEEVSGLVQRANREESACMQPSFSRRREVKTPAITKTSPSYKRIVI